MRLELCRWKAERILPGSTRTLEEGEGPASRASSKVHRDVAFVARSTLYTAVVNERADSKSRGVDVYI